ncbi:hypothetical protein LG3211_2125 [Lysobacter gummosus]|nr:hypothetical protein LG3211_2125 [Lysobacter gummosus]
MILHPGPAAQSFCAHCAYRPCRALWPRPARSGKVPFPSNESAR